MLTEFSLRSIQINDSFWAHIQQLIREVVLPHQWEALHDRVPDATPSYCIQNFRVAAGFARGTHQGMVFQDSDLYKWLEAASYSLAIAPDASLQAKADQAIELIMQAQASDGYLNTYYMLVEPDQRFQNLTEGHELYCAGHLFEAAVAYYEATGKRTLLDVAVRFADCIARYFLPGDGQNHGYPGHPEVELALIRLYHVTQNNTYMHLCQYFLNVRGNGVCWRDVELQRGTFQKHWGDSLFQEMPPSYMQDHAPVRAQRKAEGHAVRAMYLYSAMADVALHSEEQALREACLALYENVTTRQMYVTGGIGAAANGERFTTDYDLPNDSMYAETCASVGLMMFSRRIWRLTKQAACIDIFEKSLYNTVLACMGGDGQHFFYVNPLSVDPCIAHESPTLSHVATQRAKWPSVACCPPNMARTILSLGKSIFVASEEALYVLSHIESTLSQDEVHARIAREGDVYRLSIQSPATMIKLRVPAGFTMRSDHGKIDASYLSITHTGGSATYTYQLTPQVRVLRAHPRIASDAGKVCVAYGQMIYCLEEADNGKALCALALPKDASFSFVSMGWLPEGMVALRAQGIRYQTDDWAEPYREEMPEAAPVTLTFVPYSQWNNRGEGEMLVWVNEASSTISGTCGASRR